MHNRGRRQRSSSLITDDPTHEVTDTLPPVLHISTERGWRGGEAQVCLLMRGLAARGVRQSLAAAEASPLALRAGTLGIPVLPLHPRMPHHPLNLLRLFQWLRSHPGALVHAHSSGGLTLIDIVRPLGVLGGVVHTRRNAYPVRPSRKYRLAAERYVAISRAVADGLIGSGLDRDRVAVIPSAVDLVATDRAVETRELNGLAHRRRVGCVAQMAPEKGHATLLEAWRHVARAEPRALLVLVGNGSVEAGLRAVAETLPDNTVLFVGFRDDVPSWLKWLEVYVQPSLSEGLGTTVLQAMACGLPVVASRTGGLPEAIADGATGVLVPAGEPEPLAGAILDLLRDRNRARAMGAAGRERVEQQFTVEKMVEGYLDVYGKLTGQGTHRRSTPAARTRRR